MEPETFESVEIEVKIKLQAQVRGGLAYHQNVHSDGTWTVTHVASGIAVASDLTTEDMARRIVDALLATDFDWTQDAEQVAQAKDRLFPVIRNAIALPKKARRTKLA